MSFSERTADVMSDMFTFIAAELIESGVDKDEADKIALNACDELRKNFGGSIIYIPKGRTIETVLKHTKIYTEFTGNNHQELADKYNMSVPAIYRILKAAYKKELSEKQPDLLDFNDDKNQ